MHLCFPHMSIIMFVLVTCTSFNKFDSLIQFGALSKWMIELMITLADDIYMEIALELD